MVAFPGREPPGRSREYRKAVCTVRTLPAPVTHACVAGDKNVRLLAQECCSKNIQAITRTPRVVGSIRSTGLLRTRPFFCPLRASLDVSNATYRTTQHTSRSSLCRGQTLLWFEFLSQVFSRLCASCPFQFKGLSSRGDWQLTHVIPCSQTCSGTNAAVETLGCHPCLYMYVSLVNNALVH